MNSATKILIPLASGGGAGTVAEISARVIDDAPQVRGFDPAIARLADVELHLAGQKALEVYDALQNQFPRARLHLTQPQTAQPSLTCDNTSAMRGLSSANSSSAQLGLFLARALHNRSDHLGLIAATGALEDNSGTIGEVGSIDQKCEALAVWLEQNTTHNHASLTFITPPLGTDEQQSMQRLAATCAKLGIKFQNTAASTAMEALDTFNLRPAPLGRREIAARAAAAIAGVVATLAAVLFTWSLSHPVLSFEKASWTLGDDLQTPLVARMDLNANAAVPQSRCFGEDQRLQVGYKEHLVIRAKLDPSDWLDQRPLLHDVAIVVLGEASRPLVFDASVLPEPDRLIAMDGHLAFGASIPASAPAEAMKVAVIARKLFPINVAGLERALAAAFIDAPMGEQRLSRQANTLTDFAQTSVIFDYRVVEKPQGCDL